MLQYLPNLLKYAKHLTKGTNYDWEDLVQDTLEVCYRRRLEEKYEINGPGLLLNTCKLTFLSWNRHQPKIKQIEFTDDTAYPPNQEDFVFLSEVCTKKTQRCFIDGTLDNRRIYEERKRITQLAA